MTNTSCFWLVHLAASPPAQLHGDSRAPLRLSRTLPTKVSSSRADAKLVNLRSNESHHFECMKKLFKKRSTIISSTIHKNLAGCLGKQASPQNEASRNPLTSSRIVGGRHPLRLMGRVNAIRAVQWVFRVFKSLLRRYIYTLRIKDPQR